MSDPKSNVTSIMKLQKLSGGKKTIFDLWDLKDEHGIESSRNPWIGQMVEIVLKSGFKFVGEIFKVQEDFVIIDNSIVSKDEVARIRVMKADEIAVRRPNFFK